MRADFETPIDFASSKEIGKYLITYENLRELSQGSPVIGQLSIDSEPVGEGTYFGGPLLFDENYIFIPMYVRSFFRSGFKLVKVNLKSKEIEIITPKKRNLFFLESFNNGVLHYYEDMGQTSLKQINIERGCPF